MAQTDLRISTDIVNPSGVTELTHVFKAPGSIAFEDRYHHYLHRDSLRGLKRLDVRNLTDAEVHFIASFQAPKMGDTEGMYVEEGGILNLIDCKNVILSGRFENTREGVPGGTLPEQTSTAVNVCRSVVKVIDSVIVSQGRLPFVIHSGSTVEIENSVIIGSYFELFNGASSVTVRNSKIIQEAPFADSHSMLWVGSSHRSPDSSTLYENGFTIFENCEFNMITGRALVSGNGSYETRSQVEFRNCTLPEFDDNFGIASWHENYNSISVTTNGTFGELEDLVVVGPGTSGFGKFVDYYQNGGGRPGGPNQEAPIIVDGLGSDQIS